MHLACDINDVAMSDHTGREQRKLTITGHKNATGCRHTCHRLQDAKAQICLVKAILREYSCWTELEFCPPQDPDVSIRKRALDLLFTMCDSSNSVEIVQELIKYLTVADFSMREELTLKIAILAERFAPDVKWYVDVSLDLIEKAGEFVSDDIWHRVVQLVTNNEGMREYAANKVVEQLERGGTHEVRMLCCC